MSKPGLTPHPIVLRRLEVLRVDELTPRMRRITLGGPELQAFERDGMPMPAFRADTFDDHLKVVFAPGGDLTEALPIQLADGIDWGPSEHRETRDYTPVHVDLDAGELVLDFVIHSADPTAHGPAEAWAATAVPGDQLHVVGPKSSQHLPEDTAWTLLAGDETALPAIDRFLRDRPLPGPVRIVVTVGDAAAQRELPLAAGDLIDWVVAEPGDREALEAAVRAVDKPAGEPYVWAAAESRALLPVRRYVLRELGVPKNNTCIVGYWHLRDEDGPGSTDGETPELLSGPVTSPVSWFAVRAALQLGLLGACETGATEDELAARTGVPAGKLAPLLQVLADTEVLTVADGIVRPGEFGEHLLDDEHLREHFDGVYADQVLALQDLAAALPTDRSAWEHRTGTSFQQHADADPETADELAEHTGSLAFQIPALAKLSALQQAGRIGFAGPGAAVVLSGLRQAGTVVDGQPTAIIADGAGLEVQRAAAGADVEVRSAWGEHDLLLLAYAVDTRTDAEARDYLRAALAAAPRLVLLEAAGEDNLGDDVAEEALVQLGAVGCAPRDRDALHGLLVDAGWRVVDSVPLGWGVEAVTAER